MCVSNHLGYLDVLVLSARQPTVFVTSKEIEATPVLGDICAMAGCCFVERRSRRAAAGDRDMLSHVLRHHSLHLFPEGTSSNGESVLPFRSSLLAAAEQAGVMFIRLRYDMNRCAEDHFAFSQSARRFGLLVWRHGVCTAFPCFDDSGSDACRLVDLPSGHSNNRF